jgi:hypothetical protein
LGKKKKYYDNELNEAFKKFGLLEDDLKKEHDHDLILKSKKRKNT